MTMTTLRHSIVDGSGEIEFLAAEDYIRDITEKFVASPEGSGFEGSFVDFVLTWAYRYVGESPAEMAPDTFRDSVFNGIPRKYSCQASEAPHIVDELRAFCRFLDRDREHPNARACLAVLDDRAATRLHQALSDPRNFDMAKSMLMGGFEQGFDMQSQEGIEAYLRTQQPLGAFTGVNREERRRMQKANRRRKR